MVYNIEKRKMPLVDAHIHLSDPQYGDHLNEVIADAKAFGVSALVTNSVDFRSCQNDIKLAQTYPDLVYPALGIHPWNVNYLKQDELQETIDFILQQNQKNRVIAIGEIGLDPTYETRWEQQVLVFDKMLQLAEQLCLPVIIHSRGTTDKIVDMLQSYNVKHVLLHWFSHTMETLNKAIDLDYFITEGPPTVYSNSIRDIIKQAPITNVLPETDGPVLYRKKPFNGQLTKPSYVKEVLQAVAEIKNLPFCDVVDQIAKNFEIFFNIKLSNTV
ncbi:MAG: TatD family hydrolase [Nitrososphaerota archaeon]|jgi:TatD DNase family protein|nr:TatD family hydrolase [Nitrososphaerota archaeon]